VTPQPAEVAVPEKPAEVEPLEKPRHGWLTLVVVAVVAMLVGAGVATGGLLVTGRWERVPVHRFGITIFLRSNVTAEQKAAIETALPAFKPSGDITFENRDEAWRRLQEIFKDSPDILRGVKPGSMPESYNLETTGHLFDCTGYRKVIHLPGVDEVVVFQRVVDSYKEHPENGYTARIVCPG
jgi:cell division protein FtsX